MCITSPVELICNSVQTDSFHLTQYDECRKLFTNQKFIRCFVVLTWEKMPLSTDLFECVLRWRLNKSNRVGVSYQPSVELSPGGFLKRLSLDSRMELVYFWQKYPFLYHERFKPCEKWAAELDSQLAAEIPLPVTISGDFIMITDLFKVPKLHRNSC